MGVPEVQGGAEKADEDTWQSEHNRCVSCFDR